MKGRKIKNMKTKNEFKKGISLIVLVITIIVMIILVAAIIISLSNNGIIEKANQAVNESNLKQIQTMASLAWSDAYLEGKRDLELIGAVENSLLNIDEDYKSKYFVEITNSGVSLKLKEWQTIYTDGEGTIEDGSLIINKRIFNVYDDYIFTISQGETIYKYETKLIYDFDNGYFGLGLIQGAKAEGFSSKEDLMSKLENITDQGAILLGGNVILGNEIISGIIIESNSGEYKVEKIERATNPRSFIKGTKLVEGVGEVISESEGIRGYICEMQSLGDRYLLVTDYGYFEGVYFGSNFGIVFFSDTTRMIGAFYPEGYKELGIEEQGFLGLLGQNNYGELYNMGDDPNTVVEGDYIAQYTESGWMLIDRSCNSIPETVGGKNITKIQIGKFIYDVNYDKEIDVEFVDNIDTNLLIASIIVEKDVNPSKIFDALIAYSGNGIYSLDIDLTALSDVTIPTEVLTITNSNIYIYVTQEIKDKYPDCTLLTLK